MMPQHAQRATWQVYFGNFSAPRPSAQALRAAYQHWGIPVAEEKGEVDKLHRSESGGRIDGQRGRISPSQDKTGRCWDLDGISCGRKRCF